MPDRYLRNVAGSFVEVVASDTSTGASDAGKVVALDGTGKLANSMMPSGIGADTAVIQASEALAAGDLVNVWSSAGAFRARKADASTQGKEAHCFVLSAVASGANATCYFEGTDTQLSSLAPGVAFLSATTPGQPTATAPSGSGQVVQRVGFSVSASALNFNSGPPVVLA